MFWGNDRLDDASIIRFGIKATFKICKKQTYALCAAARCNVYDGVAYCQCDVKAAGPALMLLLLFGVSLVTFASFGHAFIAPIGLIVLTTMERHFITPTIIGHRLTLNPPLVFLALAFWTWMRGPFGAFLAVPLSIIGLVVFNHLFATEDVKLPD